MLALQDVRRSPCRHHRRRSDAPHVAPAASAFRGQRARAARGQGIGGKRKSRAPMTILFVMLIAAAVGGFALSRWLTDTERAEQAMLEHDLRAQVDQISRTANQLELTRPAPGRRSRRRCCAGSALTASSSWRPYRRAARRSS